ncbi:MAG: nickel pincer cofactor biosynthesis protein LarB [Proteobacteria bacterium]|nr:nickel pincer cofactor biosynthesis protein LarB [Pseudomonadota bacterium]
MTKKEILKILKSLENKKITVDEAYESLKDLPYVVLDNVRFDNHRSLRRGLPEVVYGEGKDLGTLLTMIKKFSEKKQNLLITRLSPDKAEIIKKQAPSASYDEVSQTMSLIFKKIRKKKGLVLILSAGSSDISVAKEAYVCSEFFGNRTELITDIGIAGIHRVVDVKDRFKEASCIIVVAGMEGALPSFVSAITDKPVIGVPTDVGYGANLQGFTALFGMLCNCSAGVAVVNINNGFGAAYFATLINNLRENT